jgi:apolipoprotein N-acyltransferase
VLPEHAITDLTTERHPIIRALAALAREHGAYICVGVHTRAAADAECYYDNVAMLINPDGRIAGSQAKSVPLPFFEDGNPARRLSAIATSRGTTGVCVCYDALFTDIPRRLERLGAEILLVPVMDAERWPEQERRQHADMAAFRSIELRRCAVRGASSGVSQIIDGAGRVCAGRMKDEGPGTVVAKVYFASERTLFARGGYWFAPAAGVLFVAVVAGLTLLQWFDALRRITGGQTGSHAPEDTKRGACKSNSPRHHTSRVSAARGQACACS